jgi:predicted RND superfamily exporter protein
MINDVYDNLEQDSWILTNVSTWAMVGVILSLFRRLRWMILPLAVVQASLIWIKALMYLLDIQLSLTGAMTTAMVTVVAITSSIHLAVRFREICFEQPDHVKSLHQTLVHTLPPIFWSCATTAVGFGSLAISQVAPVRAFGIAMASASMLVFVAVCVIMPGGTLLARGWLGVVPRPSFGEKQLADGLHGAARFVGRHAWLTTAATLAVLALAGVGAARLGIETDFTRNFKESSQILQGYRFVEGRLGGAGLIDVVVDAPADLHDEFLNRVRTCQSQLRTIAGVTKVTSLVDMLDLLKAGRMMIGVVRTAPPPELRQFWNPEQRRLRIVLRVTEQQTTAGKEQLMSRIDEVVHASFEPPTAVTGLYVLLVYLIDSLLEDQWSSLAISSVGIFVMMLIAFGDVRLAVVAFLPNIIPIVTTLGVMGWVDLKINVATAMIQSISMGMAVDFSIHYLYRYRHERRNGLEFYPSVSATHRQTGQAMVFADGALILGFGILTLSHFLPTIQFGMLVSLAMVGGLVGNLIMLPILLRVLFGIGPPPADAPARANIPVADLV